MVVGAKVTLKSSGDWFGTTGWVYLLGRPVYEQDNMVLSIKDVKYDVNTESVLLNTAAWAASPFVVSKIEKALLFDVSDEIQKAQAIASTYMEEVDVPNVGKLSGELSSISIGDIFVRRDELQIIAKATGKMDITVTR